MAEAPNILLTGGTGFVGNHLARGFAASGYHVILATRRERSVPGFDLWRCDPEGPLKLPSGLDAIVHAAATSPEPGVTIGQVVEDNVTFTRRLIAAARAANSRRFVLLSSMSVYGKVAGDTVDEASPLVDADAYGLTKRLCELLLEDSSDRLSGLAIRLPAVIGRGAARHWLARTATHLSAGAPVHFFHPDAPFNNAIHVDDLTKFTLDILRHSWNGYEMVTVASGSSIKVRDAIERMRIALGSKSALVEVPPHRPSFTVSVARATAEFGFAPMSITRALDRYAEDIMDASRKAGTLASSESRGTK